MEVQETRRGPSLRRALGYLLPVVALTILGIVISERREVFAAALSSAPVWLLGAAVLLQLVALLVRSEAWRLCVDAAGSTVPRRGVFRASAIGGLGRHRQRPARRWPRGSRRCGGPRRSQCPRVGALLAAEVPIVAIEASLAALTSIHAARPARPSVVVGGACPRGRDRGGGGA